MNTTMDTLIINIQSNTDSATKSIGKLISGLKKLQDTLGETVKTSKGLSSIKNIDTNIKSKVSKPKIETPSKDEQLSNLGVNMDDFKPVSILQNLNTETTKYINNQNQVLTITKKTKNGMDIFNVSLRTTKNRTKDLRDNMKLLGNSFKTIELAVVAAIASITMLIRKITGLIESAAGEAEALNLFTVSLGVNAEKGAKWIEKFSSSLFLDPVQVMQYMGSFNSLIEGLGVGSDRAYLMSQNLTQLAYDLSSFKNITIESAYEKLMSGISGELEPLRNVGVAMSEATLQTLAYELGIDKLVRNMTEAEKAQLRYVQIMRSSTEWQGDMGRTLISPANALRVLKQQFTLLGRAIGKVFIPLLMEAMPYVIAFTQIVTDLATKLAHLLGYEIPDIDYSSLGEIASGLDGVGDSAENAADKLNTMLAPFDDLNVIQKENEGLGSGLSGFGGDLDIDMPFYDALAELNEKFAVASEEAKKKLENIIPTLFTIGGIIAGWKVAQSVVDFFNFWDKVGLSATKIIGLTLGIAGISMILQGNSKLDNEETFWEGVGLKLGGTLTTGAGTYMFTKNLGITLYVTGATLFVQGMGDIQNTDTAWLGIGESLGGSLALGAGTMMLTKNLTISLAVTAVTIWLAVGAAIKDLISLEPTWQEISDAINEIFAGIPYAVVDWCFDAQDTVDQFLIDMGKSISDWWKDLGKSFEKEKKQWSENWEEFKNTISGMWDIMVDDVKTTWDNFWVNTGNTLDSNKEEWSNKFNDMKQSITTIWSDAWTNIGDTLSTKWTEMKDWFSSHFGTKEDWKRTFNTIVDGAVAVLNDLKSKFENWSAKIKTPHFSWDSKNGYSATGTIKKVLEALNLPTSIPKLNISWYEDGGYPTSGDLFFANENGIPEMVGRIGHQTAVANNDQITASITNALISALNQYDFGGGKSPTVIYIGNRKVYEGYGDYAAEENDRYGTNVIRI